MKLVNMKQEAKNHGPEIASMKADQPCYPYGLRLRLDNEALKKLGIKELPKVGSKMKIQADVEVVGASMHESTLYGEDKSIELQITDMGVSSESKE